MIGKHTDVQPTTQHLTENHEWRAVPKEVYAYQNNKARDWEVLLCWEGLPRHEAA